MLSRRKRLWLCACDNARAEPLWQTRRTTDRLEDSLPLLLVAALSTTGTASADGRLFHLQNKFTALDATLSYSAMLAHFLEKLSRLTIFLILSLIKVYNERESLELDDKICLAHALVIRISSHFHRR